MKKKGGGGGGNLPNFQLFPKSGLGAEGFLMLKCFVCCSGCFYCGLSKRNHIFSFPFSGKCIGEPRKFFSNERILLQSLVSDLLQHMNGKKTRK